MSFPGRSLTMKKNVERNSKSKVLPGGSVIRNLLCNAGYMGSIPGQGTKSPHASEQLSPHTTTREPLPHNEELLLSRFSRVDSVRPQRRQPTRLPHPWDSPGKNTGVGCHFLLQCMKVRSESEVTQSCPTLHDPWTAAYQAPPPMGFSRQEYWSGVPLPSPQ